MHPASVSLRDATEGDLPAIVDIYNRTIPGRMVTADTEPVTVESRVGWFRAHNPQTRPIWVATEQGKIAAWLSLSSFYGRPAYAATVEVSVYVGEEHRRKGLGRHLLTEAIARAPQFGVTTFMGFIWAHNEPSLRLFAAQAFERWGHLPRIAVLDGLDRDVVIVGRRVAP
jgi:L-amino acid N-acyltransferase YncA